MYVCILLLNICRHLNFDNIDTIFICILLFSILDYEETNSNKVPNDENDIEFFKLLEYKETTSKEDPNDENDVNRIHM